MVEETFLEVCVDGLVRDLRQKRHIADACLGLLEAFTPVGLGHAAWGIRLPSGRRRRSAAGARSLLGAGLLGYGHGTYVRGSKEEERTRKRSAAAEEEEAGQEAEMVRGVDAYEGGSGGSRRRWWPRPIAASRLRAAQASECGRARGRPRAAADVSAPTRRGVGMLSRRAMCQRLRIITARPVSSSSREWNECGMRRGTAYLITKLSQGRT